LNGCDGDRQDSDRQDRDQRCFAIDGHTCTVMVIVVSSVSPVRPWPVPMPPIVIRFLRLRTSS
jgi:hypothetical protein